MAETLSVHWRRLSNKNRQDLKKTTSTLAADGSLQAAQDLVRVDKLIWDACPVPLSGRLHPDLLQYKGVAGLCRPFDADRWLREMADLASDGEIRDDEREAAYAYLITNGAGIRRSSVASVKRSPLVKDHRGEWIAPESLVDLPGNVFRSLEPVVSAPSEELVEAKQFIRRLGLRRKLRGQDLVLMAEYVAEHVERADDFEKLLARSISLLTRRTVRELKDIAFLRTRSGTLEAPSRVHVPTATNESCLDVPDMFVAGTHRALYKRLGCLENPSSESLLNILGNRRDQVRSPDRIEIFYPALVDALHRDGIRISDYSEEELLWVEGAYRAPAETLVGPRVPKYFRLCVPHFVGRAEVCRAYATLGASPSPEPHHWTGLFEWFESLCPTGREAIGSPESAALRDVYRRLGQNGLPDGVTSTVRCLLSVSMTLHSLHELREHTYVENDFPELATALQAADAGVSFAQIDLGSSEFFRRLGSKSSAT